MFCRSTKFLAGRLLAVAFVFWFANQPVLAAGTLDNIRARGHVTCGLTDGVAGFSVAGSDDRWSGFDADFCRAVAAAVFADPAKISFVGLGETDRLNALSSGRVDLVGGQVSWSAENEGRTGVAFAGTSFFDGYGFLVRKMLGILSVLQLNGTRICAVAGSSAESDMVRFFDSRNMTIIPVEKPDDAAARTAYENGECDAYLALQSRLHVLTSDAPNGDEHVVLPEVVSKMPMGPVVRADDPQWHRLVRWTLFALINAEELGVTSSNVSQKADSDDAAVRRLLGTDGRIGGRMGVGNTWARDVIAAVGNYGEMYARSFGPESEIGMRRGLNELWIRGGLHYAPPIR